MKLDLRTFKIEKAALKPSGLDQRSQIAQPYLDVEASALVASDSYVLAIVPVEIEEGDASGPVPTAALIEARKRTKRRKGQRQGVSQIALNGRAEVEDGEVSFKRPEIGKFIDWKKVADEKKGAPLAVFGLNPHKLVQVAEAMGCDRRGFLRIEVYGPLKPIHVSHANGARGVVMPVRIAD